MTFAADPQRSTARKIRAWTELGSESQRKPGEAIFSSRSGIGALEIGAVVMKGL